MIANKFLDISFDGTSYFENLSDYKKERESVKVINMKTKEEHETKQVNGHEYIADEHGCAICAVNSEFARENFTIEGDKNDKDKS